MLRGPGLHRLLAQFAGRGSCPRLRDPQKGPARLGLAHAVDLDGLLRCRRAAPFPPHRPAVIAVAPRTGEAVGALGRLLPGRAVRVGMCRDRQVSVRSAIAATPDLGTVLDARAQDHQPGIGEPTWPDRLSLELTSAAERTNEAGLYPAVDGRPPGRGAEQGRPGCEGDVPRVAVRIVDDERTSFIAVTLPRRSARDVQDGGTGI